MDLFADKVSLKHEIDYNPKPEDAGRIKTTIFEEDMQVPFDESTIDIRFRPACKVAVESLSRKVYEKTMSCSEMCSICFYEFKMGERVVTLSCGHEFDDSCIHEWFAKNHVCLLCRFKLPCEI
ncbi:unnamed protein product [Arabidopsis lyrata]|uniref:RING-type domain-containing protein n=1 Tax=Arabidopsis lyrata subsp. lyrata TaxID=81972 RepID=D7KKZ4_ARALL|nr:hypothetical protein ARALYDRAFT_889703 [Arabidopsis lyrata subsp. lyrata]CAH8253168.1 unnamed protein product [Arabidopsis lyrata]